MNEFSTLLEGVLALVRNHEIQKAIDKLNAARSDTSMRALAAKQEAVQELNQALFSAKRARDQILAEISRLPERERFDAEHSLMPHLDTAFNSAIADLQTKKRRISRA